MTKRTRAAPESSPDYSQAPEGESRVELVNAPDINVPYFADEEFP